MGQARNAPQSAEPKASRHAPAKCDYDIAFMDGMWSARPARRWGRVRERARGGN
jgi:hypothetical protein